MKRRLMRPSAAFFPLALLISALFGDKTTTSMFLLLWYALQITTLCAPVAFCNAAAREPGIRRVGRRFWGGIMQLFIGGILLLAAQCIFFKQALPVEITIAAFLILIEQMFEERMFALSRRVDGTLVSLISNALLTVGLMFSNANGLNNPTGLNFPWLLGGCAAAALISALLTFAIAPGKGFTLLPVNYGFAPKAMLQVFLYPALTAAIIFGTDISIEIRHIVAGFILWQLSRTVCRRTQRESKPLDWLLTVITAVFAVLACLHPAFLPYAICCGVALICAMAIYLAPSVRLYVCAGAALSILTLAYICPFGYLLM